VWKGLDENANVVTGKLVLHAAIAEDEAVAWTEVTIDQRLHLAGRRVAREYQRRGEALVPVGGDEDKDEGED
jgi:hypothetical protein